jgi:histone H1/5
MFPTTIVKCRYRLGNVLLTSPSLTGTSGPVKLAAPKSGETKPAVKKAPAKKAVATKTATKKAPAKKAAGTKAATKKAPAKRATATKSKSKANTSKVRKTPAAVCVHCSLTYDTVANQSQAPAVEDKPPIVLGKTKSGRVTKSKQPISEAKKVAKKGAPVKKAAAAKKATPKKA